MGEQSSPFFFMKRKKTMSKLIVNADDFGLHSAVNAAVIDGHRTGIITSTSLLAGGEAFTEAVSMAKNNPKLGIGIHIALVGGLKPVCKPSEVPSLLTSKGVFPETYIDFMKRVYTGKINYSELRNEIHAQIERIMESGVHVTHIDGHQHMHVLPTVLPIIIEQAKQHGINAIRIPDESYLFVNNMYSPVRLLGKVGLSTVAAKARPTIRDNGMYSTQYFLGMVNGGQINQKTLMGILKYVSKKSGTHELMIHPGLNNTILGNLYKWGYHWEDELQAISSNHTHLYIRQNNIELINYGDLI